MPSESWNTIGYFHDLSPAELERLALLMEECAESIHVIGKIIRHGYDSMHPRDPDGPSNHTLLETELGHIEAAMELMFRERDISLRRVCIHKREKLASVKRYLHHQPPEDKPGVTTK
jgi:hypothetical protein